MKGSMEGVGCGFFLVAAEIIQRQGLQATIFFSFANRERPSSGPLNLSL